MLEDINWNGAKSQSNKGFLDVRKHGTILEIARGRYQKLYSDYVNFVSLSICYAFFSSKKRLDNIHDHPLHDFYLSLNIFV